MIFQREVLFERFRKQAPTEAGRGHMSNMIIMVEVWITSCAYTANSKKVVPQQYKI